MSERHLEKQLAEAREVLSAYDVLVDSLRAEIEQLRVDRPTREDRSYYVGFGEGAL